MILEVTIQIVVGIVRLHVQQEKVLQLLDGLPNKMSSEIDLGPFWCFSLRIMLRQNG
jgi:hypothetical protein